MAFMRVHVLENAHMTCLKGGQQGARPAGRGGHRFTCRNSTVCPGNHTHSPQAHAAPVRIWRRRVYNETVL